MSKSGIRNLKNRIQPPSNLILEKEPFQITKLAIPVQNQGACLSWTDNETKRKQTSVHSTVGRALERTATAKFILRTYIFYCDLEYNFNASPKYKFVII